MAGTTTNYGLPLIGGGSDGLYGPDEVQDVKKFNDAMKTIDTQLFAASAFRVASLTALVALLPNVPEGSIVSVGRYLLTGTLYHQSSFWVKAGGNWVPLPGTAIVIQGETSLADVFTAANVISTFIVANGSTIVFYWGSRLKTGNLANPVELVWTNVSGSGTDWRLMPGPGTVAQWSNVGGNQGLGNNVFTDRLWDTSEFNGLGITLAGGNTDFTIPYAGWYDISWSCNTTGSDPGSEYRQTIFSPSQGEDFFRNRAGTEFNMQCGHMRKCAAGTTIRASMYKGSTVGNSYLGGGGGTRSRIAFKLVAIA